MTHGWAVIAARHGCEEHAERNLRATGLRVYLPRMRVVLTGHRRPHGRGEVVLRPMLSGYLFCELHPGQWITPGPGDRWRHWRWLGERAFVNDAALDVLRDAEAREGADAAARPRHCFDVGDNVAADLWGARIAGIVRELRGNDRIIIETLAGRRVEVRERNVLSA